MQLNALCHLSFLESLSDKFAKQNDTLRGTTISKSQQRESKNRMHMLILKQSGVSEFLKFLAIN